MRYIIDDKYNNRILRDYLKGKVGLSRSFLIKLKKDPEGIFLNGERVTVRHILHEGDELVLATEDTQSDVNPFLIAKGDLPDVIYEDDGVIVVNKPSGMPTHTSQGHLEDSLANALAYYYRDRSFVFRAINRLDCETSGLVAVAKNRQSAYELSRQMKFGGIKKEYIALLEGKLKKSKGVIDLTMGRREGSVILRCVREDGARSLTEYSLIGSDGVISAVRAEPKTGRTHQLRLHFSHIGHPICGDGLYGSGRDLGIGRTALHAYKLSFEHAGKTLELEAPIPEDMKSLCERIIGEKVV